MDEDRKLELQKLSDEELALALNGQFASDLFNELIKRHEKTILRNCKNYVQNTDAAEDLCQEILVKVYLQLNTYRKDARFTTWLHSITHNLCMDYLRKNKKNLHQEMTEKLANEIGEIIELDVPDDMPTEEILNDLLEQVSAEDKMILLMKYKEKLSLHEMQEMMHIGESALKMRLNRAKNKIRQLYLNRLR
jgi:RNA polymerase sigma-70 factor (ECF subfamily)